MRPGGKRPGSPALAARSPAASRRSKRIPIQSQLTRRYTEKAVRVHLGHHEPSVLPLLAAHDAARSASHASERFKGKSARGLYGDVIEEIDWSVGEIPEHAGAKLWHREEHAGDLHVGQRAAAHRSGEDGAARPTSATGKGTTYDGGMREPCASCPGRARSRRERSAARCARRSMSCRALAGLGGAHVPSGTDGIDGRDIWPLMSALPGAKTPHEYFFYYNAENMQAVRAGHGKFRRVKDDVELYDLATDMSEKTNVAAGPRRHRRAPNKSHARFRPGPKGPYPPARLPYPRRKAVSLFRS